MALFQRTDAGKSGQSFYDTNLTPDNWYTWFDPAKETESDKTESDEGWTEVGQGKLPVRDGI